MPTKLLASNSQFLRYLIHILQLLQHAFSNTEVDYLWLSSSCPDHASCHKQTDCASERLFSCWINPINLCWIVLSTNKIPNLVYWIGPCIYLD